VSEKALTHQTSTLLFDHDGTLINSESVHLALWQNIMADHGIQITDEFYSKVMAGIPVAQNAVDLVAHFSLAVSASELAQAKHKKVSEYLSRQPFPLMPYAAESLKICFEKGYTLAIVTGGSRLAVEKTLSGYGLADYISCVVTVEDVANSKPAPDCYKLAMQKLNVTPQQCVALEDTQHGLRSAVSAGVSCVALPTEQSAKHDFSLATTCYQGLQSWLEKEVLSSV